MQDIFGRTVRLPELGSVVAYRPFGGGVRHVKVDTAEWDIKNGRPGFAGVVVGGPEAGLPVWGYLDQLV